MMLLPKPESQSCSVITVPSGVNQARSGVESPRRVGRPSKNRRRRKVACSCRSAASDLVKASRPLSTADQSTQVISLSWQ